MSRRIRRLSPAAVTAVLALSCVAAACSGGGHGAGGQDAGAGGSGGSDASTKGGSGGGSGGPAAPDASAPDAVTPPADAAPADATPDAGVDVVADDAAPDDAAPDDAAPDAATPDATADASAPADAADGPPGDGGLADATLAPFACDGPGPRFASRVVAEAFGPGQSFGQDQLPGIVLGPPKGGGAAMGSLDVASLGVGGSITLAFDGNAIVDGPGVDFIVFENPFAIGGDVSNPYAEPGTVAVSDDGVNWVSFPCTATMFPYGSCAGWHYVYANAATNTIDPTDPAVAGGDQFDLHDVGVARAQFVRVTSRPDLTTTFDLDAMSIVNAACP
jgi:hypothetical protein